MKTYRVEMVDEVEDRFITAEKMIVTASGVLIFNVNGDPVEGINVDDWKAFTRVKDNGNR